MLCATAPAEELPAGAAHLLSALRRYRSRPQPKVVCAPAELLQLDGSLTAGQSSYRRLSDLKDPGTTA
jgi:hypothetical protein